MNRFRLGLLASAVLVMSSACSMSTRTPAAPPALTTVAAAKEQDNGTTVMLEGFVIEPLGNERYIFADATGHMMVEIKDDEWDNVRVGPRTKVRLVGEVEGDYGSTDLEVDVDQIKVLQEEPFPTE